MEFAWNFIVWCVICFSPILIRLLRRRKAGKYPPGPRGWPIVGNMLDLAGAMPHRNIAKMKEKYGPVIGLKVGAVRTVAITSAKTAAVLFKKHDLDFVDRAIVDCMKCHDSHKTLPGTAPYGTFWRVLKRIYTVDMFVVKRLNETVPVRRRCVDQMLAWIDEEALNPHPIEVGRFMYLTSFNIIGSLVFSRELLDPSSKQGTEFVETMSQIMECAAKPNMSDAFPWLSRLDLQGVRRRMSHAVGKSLRIASGYVKERMEEMSKEVPHNRPKDFLDVLIEFEGDGKDELTKLTEHEISVLVLGLFMAGSETTSSVAEWVLTELLHNPECMEKAKEELSLVVGPNNKVEESHVDDLTYLQAVVKETLRLHPPIPFLVPRLAVRDTNFMGYDIPKGTRLFVNVWAIGRDAETWEDPNSFKPERFLDSKIEYKGQYYELIPFGAGRRMCAGLSLAHRILHIITGSLLHNYDWKLEKFTTRESVDAERIGVSTRKAVPLMAIPKKCAT